MTDTRTSEALSDVEDFGRRLSELIYAAEKVLTVPSEERKRAIMDRNDLRQRLLSDIESKDRAYADLSHLCANYKAESERLKKVAAELEVEHDSKDPFDGGVRYALFALTKRYSTEALAVPQEGNK